MVSLASLLTRMGGSNDPPLGEQVMTLEDVERLVSAYGEDRASNGGINMGPHRALMSAIRSVFAERDTLQARLEAAERDAKRCKWRYSLMVTDDDAGSLHWYGSCCQRGGCLRFFDVGTAEQLYPPWKDWYAAIVQEQGKEP